MQQIALAVAKSASFFTHVNAMRGIGGLVLSKVSKEQLDCLSLEEKRLNGNLDLRGASDSEILTDTKRIFLEWG